MQSAAAVHYDSRNIRAGKILQFPVKREVEIQEIVPGLLPAPTPAPNPVPAPAPAPQKLTLDELRQLGTTSDGRPLATKGDPITSLENIYAIENYFLSKKQLRNYCLFVIGINVGLRMGDLLQTKIGDYLNPDGSFREYLCVTEQKHNKRMAPVITERMQKALMLYLSKREFELDEYLFKSREGENRPIDMSQAYKIFNDMSKALKLPYHISTHSLRKTFAYWTIRANPGNHMILIQLQEMLGHDDIRTTLRYAGITREENIALYRSLAEMYESARAAT